MVLFVLILPIFQFINVKEMTTMRDAKMAGEFYSLHRYSLPNNEAEKIGTFTYTESITKGRKRSKKTTEKRNNYGLYEVKLSDGVVYAFRNPAEYDETQFVFLVDTVKSFDGIGKTLISKPSAIDDSDYILSFTNAFGLTFYRIIINFFIFNFALIAYRIFVAIVNHFK